MTIAVLNACNEADPKQSKTADQALPAALVNPMIRPLTEAIARDTANAALYYQRSAELNKMGQSDLVRADLEQAVRLEPDNRKYRESFAFVLIDQKRAQEALAQIKVLRTAQPGNATYVLMEGEAYMAGGELDKAEAIINDLLAQMPSEPDVLLDASRLKAAQKDTPQAIAYAHKVIQVVPRYFDGLYQLADLYSATGDAQALVWYDKIYRMDTLNPNPVYDAACFYQRKGNMDMAKRYFVKTIYTDKNFPDAYIQYGKILLAQDSVAKAERQFQIAIEVSPNNAEAYYQKGLVKQKQQKADSAQILFRQALVFNPEHAGALAALKK